MIAPDETKVVIAIPTFRRPARLRVLLEALKSLERPCSVAVLVADNDAIGREGLAVVRELANEPAEFPLRSILVAERGLASVRNALFAEALRDASATHVAMIDDDEWPEPGWLSALLDMQRRTGADIVGGPVLSAFEAPAPAAIRACRYFKPSRRPDGRIDIVWGTGNVLITRGCLESAGPDWFDGRYGMSGGEDVDFFIRQLAAGRCFAWASHAVIHEAVPQSRARFGWLLWRAFRVGNTNGRIQADRRFRGRGTAAVTGVALAKLLLAMGRLPVGVLRTSSRADSFCDLAEAGGMLLGAAGIRVEEYAA
jgi:succinoglycan biosynthesis protein ExoM